MAEPIITEPTIIDETRDFLVVHKPPHMHSVPLRPGEDTSLFEWVRLKYPETAGVRGKKPLEGGLLHRLDRETRGLVLIARTQDAWERLAAQQDNGEILKEYEAVTSRRDISTLLPGFPVGAPPPHPPALIQSAFRAYGPKQKSVRPVLPPYPKDKKIALDRGQWYKTEVLSLEEGEASEYLVRVRIRRGFRHQIRCHLAWYGFPIINDALYGGEERVGRPLGLLARGLSFADPSTGEAREYVIPGERDLGEGIS